MGAVRADAARRASADRRRGRLTASIRTAWRSTSGRFAHRAHARRRSTGTTDWGDGAACAFHVVSRDWQESDQVLAGIMTDFGSPTGAGAVRRRGEFDGVMTGAFRRPRVEGEFTGEDLLGLGHAAGATAARTSSSRTATWTSSDGVVRLGRIGDSRRRASSRSAIRATTAARRSTRGSASSRRDVDGCATRSRSTSTRSPGCSPASST